MGETASWAGAYLESLVRIDPRPYAARAPFAQQSVRRLLERVGNPHQRLTVIHIAGSKGKGSTALLIESILQAAGRRTGVFTSPHLQRWTERFRIDGREVQETHLAAVLERLRPHIQALSAADPAPSFFDAATAAALLLFFEASVEVAIIETGLGGRLDATNVVQPAVTCITSIELEHTDKLGDTLAAIAGEKAGIIKPGIPLVAGDLPAPAMAVVAARAKTLNASLQQPKYLGSPPVGAFGQTVHIDGGNWRLQAQLPALGRHMAQNAALAAACVRQLNLLDPAEFADAVRRGLAAVRLPGRSEILCRAPWLIVDGAHTQASIQALAEVLTTLPAQERHLVISVSATKNPSSMLLPLLSLSKAVTITQADPLRSLAPEAVAAAIQICSPATPLRIVAEPVLAVQSALRALPPDALLCATGSVYMAGLARTAFTDLKLGGFRSPSR